jgi:hypothetical protein
VREVVDALRGVERAIHVDAPGRQAADHLHVGLLPAHREPHASQARRRGDDQHATQAAAEGPIRMVGREQARGEGHVLAGIGGPALGDDRRIRNLRMRPAEFGAPDVGFRAAEITGPGANPAGEDDEARVATDVQIAAEPREREVEHPESDNGIAGRRLACIGLRQVGHNGMKGGVGGRRVGRRAERRHDVPAMIQPGARRWAVRQIATAIGAAETSRIVG